VLIFRASAILLDPSSPMLLPSRLWAQARHVSHSRKQKHDFNNTQSTKNMLAFDTMNGVSPYHIQFLVQYLSEHVWDIRFASNA
jgi:hypothetical protein